MSGEDTGQGETRPLSRMKAGKSWETVCQLEGLAYLTLKRLEVLQQDDERRVFLSLRRIMVVVPALEHLWHPRGEMRKARESGKDT